LLRFLVFVCRHGGTGVLEATHLLFPEFLHKAFDLGSGGGKVNVNRDNCRRSGEVDSAGSEQTDAVIAGVKTAYVQQLNLRREKTTSRSKKFSESIELNPQRNK